MGSYFDEINSISYKVGDNVKTVLTTIANRYIGQNPTQQPVFRLSNKNGFKRRSDYKYVLNFSKLFPDTPNEYFVYAWGKYWSDEEANLNLAFNCYSPISVYCNNELVLKSNISEETDYNITRGFSVKLLKGWNNFIIKCKKVPSGFGCNFGPGSFKGAPIHFLAPSAEREGQEGWIYSQPLNKEIEKLPTAGATEESTGIKWLPVIEWDSEQIENGQLERMYGHRKECYAFGWCKGNFKAIDREYSLKGKSYGPVHIYIDDKEVYSSEEGTDFILNLEVEYGTHDITVKCHSGEEKWGYSLQIYSSEGEVQLDTPVSIKGAVEPFIYIGPFNNSDIFSVSEVKNMSRLFSCIDGDTYWRVDKPGLWVRPFLENTLFGKWNYPLGVTLYGMIASGRAINREDIVQYVKDHVNLCTSYYLYSLWDKKEYGAAGINNLLSAIDSLDDCGSFGSLMLEVAKNYEVNGFKKIADDIAHYITEEQSRVEDGALYRKNCYISFMEDTMWADDLYMSVPFLCRYYKLTGEEAYVDDAARQFLLFKKYLFLPEHGIMSHVYNFRYNSATKVPWGRGNGWVLFSLSELLEVLPENHERRTELLKFFNELCKGYLKLQDKDGMWHQVLTDHESYQETSCTSMFTYAFARAVRFGWVEDKKTYTEAVLKAWKGLTKISIDKNGNVYGVCRGSGYSFTPDYYKNELSWLLNDTHGTGIVMLAGIEFMRLKEYLAG